MHYLQMHAFYPLNTTFISSNEWEIICQSMPSMFILQKIRENLRWNLEGCKWYPKYVIQDLYTDAGIGYGIHR